MGNECGLRPPEKFMWSFLVMARWSGRKARLSREEHSSDAKRLLTSDSWAPLQEETSLAYDDYVYDRITMSIMLHSSLWSVDVVTGGLSLTLRNQWWGFYTFTQLASALILINILRWKTSRLTGLHFLHNLSAQALSEHSMYDSRLRQISWTNRMRTSRAL